MTDCHVHPIYASHDEAAFAASMEALRDCMERAGIKRCCLMPLTFNALTRADTAFVADRLAWVRDTYPGLCFNLLHINLLHGDAFLFPLIEKLWRDGAIHGIKILNDRKVGDQRAQPLAAFLEERDIPVLIHSFYNTQGNGFGESTPADIRTLANRHPRLRIVMAHLKGCGFRGMQEIKDCPNVWVDTSGAWQEDGYFAYALEHLGPERILFGSDYPGRDMATAAARVDSVDMGGADRELVLNGNAERIFGRGGGQS